MKGDKSLYILLGDELERLDFDYEMAEPGIESSIHLARYSIAAGQVKGKKVLDLACGVGYGTHFLFGHGASQIVGVDIDENTITKAKSLYNSPGISFFAGDVQNFIDENPEEKFDVIISLETFEHVVDQTSFLAAIKSLSHSETLVIVSCPNDYWYYPTPDQSNPFHLRKFRIEEFQEIALTILGENVDWYLGTPAFGFTTIPYRNSKNSFTNLPGSEIEYIQNVQSTLVDTEGPEVPTSENCSYFVGIWNANEVIIGNAYHPLNMDVYAEMVQAKNGELRELRKTLVNVDLENKELSLANKELVDENKLILLRMHSRKMEIDFLIERISKIHSELETSERTRSDLTHELSIYISENELMRAGYLRYRKLTRYIPKPLGKLLLKIKNILTKNSNNE